MYEDSPPELIHDDLSEVVFGGHPLGRPIIGHAETLRALDLDAVAAYHDAHYVNPGHRGRGGRQRGPRPPLRARGEAFPPGPAPWSRADLPCPSRATWHTSPRRTPSSTTSASAARASSAATRERYAVLVVDTILGGSWSSACSRRSARSAASHTPSTRTPRCTPTPGWRPSTSAPGRREWGRRSESSSAELRDLEHGMADEAWSGPRITSKGARAQHGEPGRRMQSLGRAVLPGSRSSAGRDAGAHRRRRPRRSHRRRCGEYYDAATWSAACIGPKPGRSAYQGHPRRTSSWRRRGGVMIDVLVIGAKGRMGALTPAPSPARQTCASPASSIP